jgi:serine/threonine protein kinase
MASLPGYDVRDTLAESRSSVVLRATRIPDGRAVVLKTSRSPTPEQVARLTRDFEMARRLSSVPGVIEVIELLEHEGTHVMVMEDIGGESLDLAAEKSPLGLREGLEILVKVADTLGHLHDRHVMHKDVNPSNLVWNRPGSSASSTSGSRRSSGEPPTLQTRTFCRARSRTCRPSRRGA